MFTFGKNVSLIYFHVHNPTHNEGRFTLRYVHVSTYIIIIYAYWNQLPEEVFGFPPAKAHAFSKRVRKAVDRL
jgi:hypothetical protein